MKYNIKRKGKYERGNSGKKNLWCGLEYQTKLKLSLNTIARLSVANIN